MGELERIKTYWNSFVESQDSTSLPEQPYVTEQFGDSSEMADLLGKLIVLGRKIATCSVLWGYEADGEPIPTVGQRAIVLDGSLVPLCIREITEVEICALREVDAQFAYDEGEGDQTLESWRREHWAFFSRTLPGIGRQPSHNMPLICERFRVIYP